METRSSPSVSRLHSLAREAEINHYSRFPKTFLFHILRSQRNLSRLERAHARSANRRAPDHNGQVEAQDEGEAAAATAAGTPPKRQHLRSARRRKHRKHRKHASTPGTQTALGATASGAEQKAQQAQQAQQAKKEQEEDGDEEEEERAAKRSRRAPSISGVEEVGRTEEPLVVGGDQAREAVAATGTGTGTAVAAMAARGRALADAGLPEGATPSLRLPPHDMRRRRRPPAAAAAAAAGEAERPVAVCLMDPVMLLPIPEGAATLDVVRPNGKVVTFDAATLADYLLASGDFKDPETRLPLSDDDLRRLDEVLSAGGLHPPLETGGGGGAAAAAAAASAAASVNAAADAAPPRPVRRFESVLAAKRDPGRFREMRCTRDGLTGLERCAGEVVVEMVGVVEGEGFGEGGGGDFEAGQLLLACHLLPALADLHRQLHANDPAFAAVCMEHFSTFVEGPPNRPTRDVFGLLPIVRSFFHQIQTEGPSQSGF